MPTAADAYYGGSIVTSISADYRLTLVSGANSVRLYDLNPTVGGLKVVLPDATKLPVGGPLFVVRNRNGANTLTVVKSDTVTTVVSLPFTQGVELLLLDNSTANGTWHPISHSSVTAGGALTLGREPWVVTVDTSDSSGFDVRAYLDAHGYGGINPVALSVTVALLVSLGAPNSSSVALTTGDFPAGSTCLLLNHGYITGAGGDGGRGGEAGGFGDPPDPGEAGGPALRLRMNTALVNYGTIGGGGGGGGGGTGDIAGTQGGGGGGGGAGFAIGVGGAQPFSGGATAGSNGAIGLGGAGGLGFFAGGSGGSGGDPGTAGGGSGGAGGVGGKSILKKTGITLNTIRTGTILGAEAFEP